MRMRDLGGVLTSVGATAPEINSMEPPLEALTRAMAVSVKRARSPPRSPSSLKSCSVTLGMGGGGFVGASVPALNSAGNINRPSKAGLEKFPGRGGGRLFIWI